MRYVTAALLLLAACSSNTAAPKIIVPSLSIVAGDAQTDTVGKTLPVQLGAKLTDATTGLPLPGRVLNWVVVTGGGALFVGVTQTGSDGTGKNSWTLGTSAGGQKVVARYIDPETGAAVTLDTATATAIAGAAASFNIVPDSLDVHFSAAQTDTLAVEVGSADSYGNATAPCQSLGWASEDTTRIWSLGTTVQRGNQFYALFRIDFSIGGSAVHLTAHPACGKSDAVAVSYAW